MTFEGQHMRLPIKGIMRAGADNICEDGSMNEVIGLEYKDGSYVPYQATLPAEEHRELDEEAIAFYIHKTSSGNNIIELFQNDDDTIDVYWATESEFGQGQPFTRLTYLSDIKCVSFIGNVICASTSSGMKYAIFSNNTYKNWGIYDTSLHEVSLRVTNGIYDSDDPTNVDKYGVCFYNHTDYDTEFDDDVVNGLLTKVQGLAAEYGGLTGNILACYGWRLSNGQVVNISPIAMLGPAKETMLPYNVIDIDDTTINLKTNNAAVYDSSMDSDNDYSGYATRYDTATGSELEAEMMYDNYGVRIYTDLYYGPPMYCFKYLAVGDIHYRGAYCSCNRLQFRYKNYSGSALSQNTDIKSLCIFISPEVSRFKEFSYFDYIEVGETGTTNKCANVLPVDLSTNSVVNKIKDINGLYLIEEIPVEDLTDSDSYVNIDLKGKLGDTLLTLEQLNVSDMYTYSYINANLNTYNSRLHLYRFSQTQEKSWYTDMYFHHGGGGQEPINSGRTNDTAVQSSAEVDVYLRDGSGNEYVRVLFRGTQNYNNNKDKGISISPYISYPDPNAYKIVIKVRQTYNNDGAVICFSKEMGLTENELGISCFINSTKPMDLTSYTTENLPSTTDSYLVNSYKNKLVVSDTNYPSYFPKTNTYTIGDGSIIGIAKLSIALSQDTYGTNPLLIFCTDGIYTLSINTSGTGVYDACTPFSREVCTNVNSICEVDGGVIFASSKGLMCATAEGVQMFTPNLNGEVKHTPQSSKTTYGLGLSLYRKAINNASSVQLTSYVDTTDFINYVQDSNTHVTYASVKNKIVVYNKNKSYSYWIDIQTRNATKLPVKIIMDNNDYPSELYCIDGASGGYFSTFATFEYATQSGNVPCLLQTRPIKLVQGLKTSYRVVLRGEFESECEYSYVISNISESDIDDIVFDIQACESLSDGNYTLYSEGDVWRLERGTQFEEYFSTEQLKLYHSTTEITPLEFIEIYSEVSFYYLATGPKWLWSELLVLGSLDGENWQPIGVRERKSCTLYSLPFHDLGCVTDRVSCNYMMVIFSGKLNENSHIDGIEITIDSKYNNKLR